MSWAIDDVHSIPFDYGLRRVLLKGAQLGPIRFQDQLPVRKALIQIEARTLCFAKISPKHNHLLLMRDPVMYRFSDVCRE